MTISRAASCGVGALATIISVAAASFSPAIAADEVNIYSYREPGLIAPLLKAFTDKTGIKPNVVYAKDGLIERAAAEGANSPFDVLLTVDIGRLTEAEDKGITQAISSDTVKANIPSTYLDPQGHWVGLSKRARFVYASKDRVKQDSITYEELADPKWKGKICARSGQHPYNIALLASIIAHSGIEKAEAWAKGVKENLARKPAGGDRDQVKGIYSGECDLAIGNSYYMAAMQTNTKKPEQQEWAKSAKILFPNADDRGTHVNISGAVLAKHAPHKDAGVKLIEFLTSEEGQKIYAEIVNEYPLKEGVPISERVASWGTLKPDKLPLEEIAKHRAEASAIMDRVGFDAGPGA
ncbi:Iron uptake protein A1 [Candidatus Filomicrobium marinum]|uniref:Iron uptake protein A1 n=2 Tax=Filomicrobium TaxID=119044 RepID=A0A0D6JBW8_9HYPH|nr:MULTISPECIES: Fe(3+) ABC transporter substrate-binding protein [Filomicrobium]MCV0370525.1 Fe(3+) ABC transporter substrate-binding protein [Filomicrobium sp.]CFX08280.1 Iron uptake protein A1 [Candidatus Filomicrobium marinum]CPR16764.1 Iron uptake protein A1 [Candidatus Filomicrobium marinum]SDP59777.1 iron(III) transport system substrate-binding protein [Filomicrobium insigne]